MPTQRDLFIDFLKGLCIICVVLTHNLPHSVMKASAFVAWGSMAVPLFLLIQSYHVFHTDKTRREMGLRSKTYKEHYNLAKLWKRIAMPFIIVTIITGAVLIVFGHDPIEVMKSALLYGGIGPGSYYVWIYLQFFLLLPLCLIFVNKWGGYALLILFVVVSQGVEWLCIYIDMPEPIYRLTSLRYIFLIYLGYVWATNKISRHLSTKQIVLSLISLIILLALYYSTGSLKPFLHDTTWRPFHWICYFYVALLLPWLIWKFYDKLPNKIKEFIGEIGKWSYEIFLIQMMIFTLYPHSRISFGNIYIDTLIFIVLTTVLSIFPIFIWKKCKRQSLSICNKI